MDNTPTKSLVGAGAGAGLSGGNMGRVVTVSLGTGGGAATPLCSLPTAVRHLAAVLESLRRLYKGELETF